MFSDEKFRQVCDELKTRDTDGYEFFTQSHSLEIYRKYTRESGLYQYKVYGMIDGIPPQLCYEVYKDITYRKTWDGYVKELYEVENTSSIYWRVAYPFPMSHRDYVYEREDRNFDINDQLYCVFLAQASDTDKVPPVKGVIRVTDYFQELALTSNGGDGTTIYMHYYDDPKGTAPAWLFNWAAKTGLPKFLKDMTKACHKYPAYKDKTREN